MNLTPKQYEILRVISAGNGPDDPADLDQIIERLRYETHKPAVHFQIRAMVISGLIIKKGVEKRRGRHRQVIAATKLGHDHMIASRISVNGADEIVELGFDSGPLVVDLSI